MTYVHSSSRVHNKRFRIVVILTGENIFPLAALPIDSKLEINRLKLPPSYHSPTPTLRTTNATRARGKHSCLRSLRHVLRQPKLPSSSRQKNCTTHQETLMHMVAESGVTLLDLPNRQPFLRRTAGRNNIPPTGPRRIFSSAAGCRVFLSNGGYCARDGFPSVAPGRSSPKRCSRLTRHCKISDLTIREPVFTECPPYLWPRQQGPRHDYENGEPPMFREL